MKPIYLDYNATTPLDPVVAEAMHPYLARPSIRVRWVSCQACRMQRRVDSNIHPPC